MTQIKKLSPFRILLINIGEHVSKKSYPTFLTTRMDITDLLIYKKNKNYSLNAILIKHISDVLKSRDDFAPLNSLLKRTVLGPRLHLFEDVDISLNLDRFYKNERIAANYIIEKTNQKSIEEIDREVKHSRTLEVEDLPSYDLLKSAYKIPYFLQKMMIILMQLLPSNKSKSYGTLTLSNIGRGASLAISAASPKTLFFAVGGTERVLQKNNKGVIVERELLNLTLTINHYVIDGMITNIFLTELKNSIENSYQNIAKEEK